MLKSSFTLLFFVGFALITSSFTANAKITLSNKEIRFTNEDKTTTEESEDKQIRFEQFKKFNQMFSHDDFMKYDPIYSTNEESSFTGLTPFTEIWQRTDFIAAKDKSFAVLYGARCEKPWPSAEHSWSCNLNGVIVDHNGYVTGEIGGDFVEVKINPNGPYVILKSDTAGDSQQQIDVYTLAGELVRSCIEYK